MVPSEFVPLRSFPRPQWEGRCPGSGRDASHARQTFPLQCQNERRSIRSKRGSRRSGRDYSKSTRSDRPRTSSLLAATPCWQHGCCFKSSGGLASSSRTPCWWNIRRFEGWRLTSARARLGDGRRWSPSRPALSDRRFHCPRNWRKPVELHRARCRARPRQPAYGLQLPAYIDHHQAHVRILAANCVKQVRAVQPFGPYYLAGHSSGGMIVFEMACQLMEQGETVGLLRCWIAIRIMEGSMHRPLRKLGFAQGIFSPRVRRTHGA